MIYPKNLEPDKVIIRVISLERRKDRRQLFCDRICESGIPLENYDFEFFDAYDGQKLIKPTNWRSNIAAFGCKLSWCSILLEAIKLNKVLIGFEDDATFVPDFWNKLIKIMDVMPSMWENIYLGGQHISPPDDRNTSFAGKRKHPDLPNGVVINRAVHRTHALIARGKYLGDMLQSSLEHPSHIDHSCSRSQSRDIGLKVYRSFSCSPFICGQGGCTSDITKRMEPERIW